MGAKVSSGLRVLMLLENNPFPEDERVDLEARELVSAGHVVSVICPRKADQPMRELIDGVRVYRYRTHHARSGHLGYLLEYGSAMVSVSLLTFGIFLRRGFDVIHAHNPPDTFVFVAAFYKLLGKRFVFDHHDLAPEMYQARFWGDGKGWTYRLLLLFERISCRLADRVIATNASYKAIEMTRGDVPEERISIVRNGPDLSRLRPVEPDPDLRQRAGTLLGYVGIMGAQDGVDYLLRAVYHLVYDLARSDLLCVIIGTGDALPDLQALTKQLRIEEHVWFVGWVSDPEQLSRYLSTVDICTDPDPSNSYNDNCTMVKIMEYMAFGKPTVAFDLPEHRATAPDSVLYARPNDERDFAEKIAFLIDHPEERERLGGIGSRRVRGELAWSYQAKYLLQAYETLRVGSERDPTPT